MYSPDIIYKYIIDMAGLLNNDIPDNRIIGIPGGNTYTETRLPATNLITHGGEAARDYKDVVKVVIPNAQIASVTGFLPSQFKACLRFSSECRQQKAILLLHAVGSGKTITSLCMSFNTNPTIHTTVITIRGLETSFRDEYKNMTDIYHSEPLIDSKFNQMRCVFYDEFASKLLNLSTLSLEEREKQVALHYTNRLLIFDEAHKLLAILEKDNTGASERMLKFILSRCVKAIFMTATPLQRDWSDFGKLMKLIAQTNDPNILSQVKVWNERVFKKTFWFPDDIDPHWKIKNNVYTVFFVKLIQLSELLVNYKMSIESKLSILKKGQGIAEMLVAAGAGVLQWINDHAILISGGIAAYLAHLSTSGNLHGGALMVTAVGSGLASIGKYIISGATSLSALASGGAYKVSAMGIAVAEIALWTNVTLSSIKLGIDLFSISVEPLDIQQVALLFYPHISFNDYKATEIQHINNSTRLPDDIVRNYETILSRFPVLNVHNINVNLEWHQLSALFFNLNRGYVPTSYDLYSVGRISADIEIDSSGLNFRYLDSTELNQNDTDILQSALRSVGNFSLDCVKYLPIPYTGTNPLFKDTYIAHELTGSQLYQYHGRDAYDIDVKPHWDKIREAYLLENAKLQRRGLTTRYPVFSCNKFNKALELITEARKKFIYLPVVYSNFLDQGLKRFSAFLSEQKLPHIILAPSVLAENPDFIEKTQKPYMRWVSSPEMSEHLISENNDVGQLNRYAIYQQPCCIIIDPSLQEGLSLIFNEVMICIEPMAGYGNQEQVYGRIVRSYSEENKIINIRNYELYNNTYYPEFNITGSSITVTGIIIRCKGYSKEDTTNKLSNKLKKLYDDCKEERNHIESSLALTGRGQFRQAYLKYIEMCLTNSGSIFKSNSKYESRIFLEDNLNARPQKFCFQLVSQAMEGPSEDQIIKIHLRSLFTNFCEKLSYPGFNLTSKLSVIINKLPLVIPTPLYNADKLIDSVEVPENLRQVFLKFVQNLIPNYIPCIHWGAFIPYSIIYASYVELANIGTISKTNPQQWNQLAESTNMPTSLLPTPDQFWFSRIKIQEFEFNRLREEFNKISDDDIDNLYPTTDYVTRPVESGGKGLKEHFRYDRYTCKFYNEYYPHSINKHARGHRCTIKHRRSRSYTDTCDKIGPAATHVAGAQPGGARRRRLTKKRGGGGNRNLQQQQLLLKRGGGGGDNRNLQQQQLLLKQNAATSQDDIKQLQNIYNTPENCVSFCEQDPRDYLLPILKLFDGKSDEDSGSIAIAMLAEFKQHIDKINSKFGIEVEPINPKYINYNRVM
jgi:hypothetical protein